MSSNPFRLLCLVPLLIASVVIAQDSTLTYQGQLRDGGQPVTGTVNLEFRLFDQLVGGSEVASPQSRLNWPVEDGLFQVDLNFGTSAFDGSPRFLEVRVNGAPLIPRQRVTATPVALLARDVAPGSIGSDDIDPASVQVRVDGACGTGQAIRSIGSAGTVTCENLGNHELGDVSDVLAENPSVNDVLVFNGTNWEATFPRNLLPIAWGWVQSGALVFEGFGIQSISSPSTGIYEITLTAAVSGYPAVIATAFTRTGNAEILGYVANPGSNVIAIRVYDGADGTTLKNSDFSFFVYDN